jgi:hypothetical protein
MRQVRLRSRPLIADSRKVLGKGQKAESDVGCGRRAQGKRSVPPGRPCGAPRLKDGQYSFSITLLRRNSTFVAEAVATAEQVALSCQDLGSLLDVFIEAPPLVNNEYAGALACYGLVIGEVAHEIRNSLFVLYLLSMKTSLGSQAYAYHQKCNRYPEKP